LFENIQRIAAEDYRPTPFDMLCTRTKTTGVVEKLIKVNDDLHIKLVDVGGQRNERRKWFSLFDQCTLVIFLCAASDFNKLLYEGMSLSLSPLLLFCTFIHSTTHINTIDDETNRMIENLNLFKETVNNRWFKDKPFVVLYNKMDVFKEKIEAGQKITDAFPDYDGPHEPRACIEYIKKKYQEQRETKAPIYAYETMATDTDETKLVWESVKNHVMDIINAEKQQSS
jgi:signal recognition particle receptor subunit beta